MNGGGIGRRSREIRERSVAACSPTKHYTNDPKNPKKTLKMVYESDFYTTRRPYRPSSYSVTRHAQKDWEKVPYVPRPSLVPDPITAFGRRERALPRENPVLTPQFRASIKPNQKILSEPIKPYMSPRDLTREKVLLAVRRQDLVAEAGGQYSSEKPMDLLLPQLHGTKASPHYKTRVYYSNYASY